MRGVLPIAIGIAVVVTVIGITAVVAIARSRGAKRNTALLAAALGLARVPRASIVIYSGTYAGHPVATAHAFVRETLGGEDGRRGGHWALRIALGLRLGAPLGFSVSRPSSHLLQAAMSGRFEGDFHTRSAERIDAAARASLIRFAQAHGHFSLADRAQLAALIGGGEVLIASPAVLIHDEPGLAQTADDVVRWFDAMIAAVAPIEAHWR